MSKYTQDLRYMFTILDKILFDILYRSILPQIK